VPGEFVERIKVLAEHFHTISWAATLLASSALLIIILCMKYVKRVPGYIVVLILGTLAV